MAFDGNGTWIPEFSAKEDRDAGIKILASRFDDVFQQDLKESFEKCLTIDGQNKPSADFNFNNFKGINLADPVLDNDAVNKKSAVLVREDQTIQGVKTFTEVIKSATPTSATEDSTNVATTAWATTASKEGNLFGAPNYAAAIAWSGLGKKTAPSNGFFHIAKIGNWAFFEGKINNADGNGVPIYLGRDGANYWSDGATQVALKKDDYIDILRWETSGSGYLFGYFIPCL